jgi:predicted AlkP superfamily pyrophosphatase or phosphodiesterase
MLLSIPGLRPGDVHDSRLTPTLYELASRGEVRPMTPTFPCVTSPVQANMLTGAGPAEHGVLANGFFHADRGEVEFWMGRHGAIERPTFFARLAQQRPGITSAAWHLQNIKDADATFIITPAPIHEADGTTKLWCYSRPEGFYQELLTPLGHFPLQHYWGPLANIQSTRWILEGALWLAQHHAPHLQYIYVPHLDYAAQKFGATSHEAGVALEELDKVLADFMERYERLPGAAATAWILAGEYALTDVSGAIHPNRMLREAGLLRVREERGHEYVDLDASDAFAMVDHQFAHVYVNRGDPQQVAELFARSNEIPDIIVGRERVAMGMDHPRRAPIILISRPDRWFAYYWWMDDAAAPPFARTVDIHAKPGYDPVELFIKMPERQIPLDASLVKGSHGAPVTQQNQQSALITTEPRLIEDLPDPLRDTDVYRILCRCFDL